MRVDQLKLLPPELLEAAMKLPLPAARAVTVTAVRFAVAPQVATSPSPGTSAGVNTMLSPPETLAVKSVTSGVLLADAPKAVAAGELPKALSAVTEPCTQLLVASDDTVEVSTLPTEARAAACAPKL